MPKNGHTSFTSNSFPQLNSYYRPLRTKRHKLPAERFKCVLVSCPKDLFQNHCAKLALLSSPWLKKEWWCFCGHVLKKLWPLQHSPGRNHPEGRMNCVLAPSELVSPVSELGSAVHEEQGRKGQGTELRSKSDYQLISRRPAGWQGERRG